MGVPKMHKVARRFFLHLLYAAKPRQSADSKKAATLTGSVAAFFIYKE